MRPPRQRRVQLCLFYRQTFLLTDRPFRGTVPTLILEALSREPSHGYRIAQSIKKRSQGVLDFKESTLYPALHKLENEGLVESYGRGEGRPRRYYCITEAGRKTLTRDRAEWREISQVLGEA